MRESEGKWDENWNTFFSSPKFIVVLSLFHLSTVDYAFRVVLNENSTVRTYKTNYNQIIIVPYAIA